MSATPSPKPGAPRGPRTTPRPAPRLSVAPAAAPARPESAPERRRRKRGWFSRWAHRPVSLDAMDARAGRAGRAVWRWARWAVLAAGVAGLAWGGARLAELRHPVLVARHRAEALCFALAAPPAFAPPMAVECASAIVRGRFGTLTPPGVAVREAMGLRADMVLQERRYTVGDFDVTAMWLRLPPGSGATYWMVLAWMEGSDLATSSFGFAGDEADLTREQRDAGEQVLRRVLLPDHFRAGVVPDVRWRAPRGETLPRFGPRRAG